MKLTKPIPAPPDSWPREDWELLWLWEEWDWEEEEWDWEGVLVWDEDGWREDWEEEERGLLDLEGEWEEYLDGECLLEELEDECMGSDFEG